MLDRLIKPHWPYMPETCKELHLGEISDRVERELSSVADEPLNYYFWYHLLDADEKGKQPKIGLRTVNKWFNLKSVSSLRHIAESGDKVEYWLLASVCNSERDYRFLNLVTRGWSK